jgi:hypothetical protein
MSSETASEADAVALTLRLGREDAAGEAAEAPAPVGDQVSRSAVEVCGFRTGTALSIASELALLTCCAAADGSARLAELNAGQCRCCVAWRGVLVLVVVPKPIRSPSASWNSYNASTDMWATISEEPLVGGLWGRFGPERVVLGSRSVCSCSLGERRWARALPSSLQEDGSG